MRQGTGPRRQLIAALAVLLTAAAAAAPAEEFDGVQPAALDQPRVNLLVRRQPRGQPLAAAGAAGNVEAFLDTGASGILLADHTAATLGVARDHAGPAEVRFHDIGVGGGDAFAVSERLYGSLSDSGGSDLRLTFGPVRAEIGPVDAGNRGVADALAAAVLGDLDVAGMPAMVGRVVVMDPRDVNRAADKIRTTVLDPRRDAAAVPRTRRHVRLSYADFAPYTSTDPPTAAAPDLAANPFIGPSPLKPAGDRTPPVVVAHNGKQSSGSWLLDTGAATSMISRRQAEAVGVTFAAGTANSDDPQLVGAAADRQFTMTVGGIGGTRKAAGFYLDRLTLRTTEGRPVTYLHAPVLVVDITAKDAATGRSVTLDGVFGMNFLVASARLTEGVLPDVDHVTPGPYRLIVFDQPKGLLGLD